MNAEGQSVLVTSLDARMPVLMPAQTAAMRPARGWLRAVRTALGLSQAHVARKVMVTKQSYGDLEHAEERGAITLNSLQRAADSMDCEMVYFLVPRAKVARTFRDLAQRHDPQFKHLQASEHSMALENQAVGDLPPRSAP